MKRLLATLPLLLTVNAFGLPAHFDLRESTNFPPVRRQSTCANTWGAATVDMMAIKIKMKDGVDVMLSEQFIAACNKDGHKCNGGGLPHLEMMVSPGAVLEKDFPHVGHDVECPASLPIYQKAQAVGQVPTPPWRSTSTVEALKQAIFDHGPVMTALEVTSKLSVYKGGVFQQCDGHGSVNHLMMLVGWDDREGYWIARNTWGSSWGEKGYVRIAYQCNGIGSMAQYLEY